MSVRTILIMAGGTGGHIMPGLAVAEELRKSGWQVIWMGVPDSMEAELVPRQGYQMAWVNFSGLRGKGVLRAIRLPFSLLVALWQSTVAIFRHRPDVVLGMGGYVTFPGGLASALLRRPLVIHEQNSIAGLSNRVLARMARKVMSGFPDVLPGAIWCGNPVRSAIASLPAPQQRYASHGGRLKVLVVGGSLGAQAINTVMPQALARLPESSRPDVIHQTGKAHFEAVQQLYRETGVQAGIHPFLDDMAKRYAEADLVICRAGALTIAELAAAGIASILIPFPFAVDDHQTSNARFLSERGAAILLPQGELNADRLAQLFIQLGRDKLTTMAEKAHEVAKPEAAADVARICMEMAEA